MSRVISINPNNGAARQALARLSAPAPIEHPSVDDIAPASAKSAPPIAKPIAQDAPESPRPEPLAAPPASAIPVAKKPLVMSVAAESAIRDERSGYVDQNLMPGECVMYHGHLHWAVYLAPFILILFGAFWCAGIALINRMVSSSIYVGAAALLGGLFGRLLLIAGFLDWLHVIILRRTSEFGVTNKRVLIQGGFIRRHSLELLLAKVEGIHVDQPILGRIWGYGTIIVTGTGGTHEPFKHIDKPMEFRKRVQRQIELMAKRLSQS